MKKLSTDAVPMSEILPADECALIGLCMEYPAKVGEILAGMEEKHFTSTIMRGFYAEINRLFEASKPVVSDYVKNRVIAANDGLDAEYMNEAFEAVDYSGATMESLDIYKKVVLSQWMYDASVELAAGWVSRMKKDDELDVSQMIHKLKEDMDKVISGSFSVGMSPLDIFDQDVVRFIEEAAEEKEPYKLTGIKSMDDLLSKPSSGELIVLQAGASHGKTSFITSLTRTALKARRPYAYRSGEMRSPDLVKKDFQGEFQVSTKFMSEGHFASHKSKEDFIKDFRELLSTPEALNSRVDSGRLSIPDCRSLCYHNFHKFGTDLFIFDRAELFAEAGTLRSNIGDQQRVIGQGLRAIANELGVTIVIVAQLTKESATKRKSAQGQYNAMGGMAWPANATMILELYNPSQEGLDRFPNGGRWQEKATRVVDGVLYQMVSLTIKKNTYGSKGTVLLAYWPDGQVFFDLGKVKVAGSSYDAEKEAARITAGKNMDPGVSLKKVSMSDFRSDDDDQDDGPEDNEFGDDGEDLPFQGGGGNFSLGLT